MIRKTDIVSILRKVISEMDIVVKVSNSTDNGDGTFTIETCNTQYLNKCSRFKVNNVSYSVVDMVDNESIKIKGSPQLDQDFSIRSPLFIPDTRRGANNEVVLKASDPQRNPFIWLLEDFRTEYDLNNKLTIAEPRVRLFFLTGNDEKEWLEETHREMCIYPMQNLCDRFIEELEKKVSGKVYNFSVLNRLRFGNREKNSKTLSDNLSGVELDIMIPLKKWSVKCKEC